MPSDYTVARIRGRLHLSELIALNDFIWSANTPKVLIDFDGYSHSSIFDLTFLAHQIKAIQLKKKIRVESINDDHMSWARGMNFFSVSGTDWASQVSANRGDGHNFIPITIIECGKSGSALSRTEMNEEIDRHASKLAKVLLHLGSGPTYDTIQYTFREVIRNIFEHSGAKTFLMSGQYYPSHGNVQIVIADTGLGIPNSLRFNKSFKNLSDRDALQIALMPGVSGNASAMRRERTDIWQNSGYGLYMMTRLARNRGMMTVISGNNVIHINNSDDARPAKENFTISNFSGTLIRLGIKIDDMDLAPKLQEWAEEGKIIARDIAGAKQLDASAASLLLRRDFERNM
ncbi:ATP-binding protein [Falsiroseomonas tokyonensis]|uniref:ATP-binding protein n=1 Tax=Falsiroseomonas tokyonensis TaxID=430521 RepID=A0ABV7BYV0_9PROT|nr:ATP-binding protein [Falsiroseomonas tokyonensis]MBU8540716.1 ATP-binding protein [Falsiroseomonas tokyonensis]